MKSRFVCTCLAGLLLLGCSGTTDKQNGERQSNGEMPKVTAETRNLADIDKSIASHQGKVVVVDLWALW